MPTPKTKTARAQRLAERHQALLEFERNFWARGLVIAGLDEAGAGPLAGPVTAACVVLDPAQIDSLVGVDDSKSLSKRRREAHAAQLKEAALAFAVANASVEEIDEINIREAGRLAMQRALTQVCASLKVDHLLVDARTVPGTELPQTSLIKGDARSLSIAGASILAKVDRDAQLLKLDERYPGYGFSRHAGYGTKAHLEALERLGPCPAHRRSFQPVKRMLEQRALPLGDTTRS